MPRFVTTLQSGEKITVEVRVLERLLQRPAPAPEPPDKDREPLKDVGPRSPSTTVSWLVRYVDALEARLSRASIEAAFEEAHRAGV